MAVEVKKGQKKNYLLGTAHFFPYSFKKSLQELLSGAKTVLFEGPLKEEDLEYVSKSAVEKTGSGKSLLDLVDRKTRQLIIREITGPRYPMDSNLPEILLNISRESRSELEAELEGLRPWMAFFRIWVMFLRKKGWKHSVDLEAHEIARRLRKTIHYLESLEEQLRALEGIPLERIVNFLEMFNNWDDYARRYVRSYLEGDLDAIMNSTVPFPTRCESILERRDPILFERMLPYFEEGDAIALVGVTHLRGVIKRLGESGFECRHVK